MKSSLYIYLFIFIFVLTAASCGNHSGVLYRIPQNEGIINFKDFHVSSDSTDLETTTRGTVFIRTDDFDNYYVQITAWVETDPSDHGGIGFTFPFGWKITSITSSYPYGQRIIIPKTI